MLGRIFPSCILWNNIRYFSAIHAFMTFRNPKMSSNTTKAGASAEQGNSKPRKPSPEICSIMMQLSAKLETLSPSVKDHLTPCDPGYGTPVEGSVTACRGRKAHSQIAREIIELCQIITMYGQKKGKEYLCSKKRARFQLIGGERNKDTNSRQI